MTLVINSAVGCSYFFPGPRLPSQLQTVTAVDVRVYERLLTVSTLYVTAERPVIEPATFGWLVRRPR